MNPSDRQTIAACLNGHPDEFRQLVRRYHPPLFSFLFAQFGTRQGAEEAAQETFVRAYFALARLADPDSFLPWLLGIAIRVAHEQRRTEERQRRAAQALPEPSAPESTGQDGALANAVAALPAPYREVVVLRYYGGVSCAEVAERLGLPLGTVTKRLSRAYALLREALAQ